jgi:hypothetical protein
MSNVGICDGPELWPRMKTAKEILHTEGFPSKYRSPPSSPIEEATKSSPAINPEVEVIEEFEVRAMLVPVPEKEASFPQDQTPELEDPNPARGSIAMSSEPTVKGALHHSLAMKPNEISSNPRIPTLTPVSSSLSQSKKITKQRYYPVIPLTREEAIALAKGASKYHNGEVVATTHREVSPNLTPAPSPLRASVAASKEPPRVQQGSSKSHLAPISVIPPVRNGTTLRLRARSLKPLSPRKQKSHAPHIPSPLAKEISATPSLAPSESPEIRVRPRITFTFGKFFCCCCQFAKRCLD